MSEKLRHADSQVLCEVQSQPCPVLARNEVHYNFIAFSDDIQRLFQTTMYPQETETICFLDCYWKTMYHSHIGTLEAS